MSQGKAKYYEVYRDAERIELREINWAKEETGTPSLKVSVSIDGRIIQDVTFKRDITSKAYAMPPLVQGDQSSEVTILFGGEVQEILDRFADYILPAMKPLGINPLTGETVLNLHKRTDAGEIKNSKRKIQRHQFIWQR